MNPYRDSFHRLRDARRHLAMAQTLCTDLHRLIRALPDEASPQSEAQVKIHARRIFDAMWAELVRAWAIGHELGRSIPSLEPARAFATEAWRSTTWQQSIPDLARWVVDTMDAWLPETTERRAEPPAQGWLRKVPRRWRWSWPSMSPDHCIALGAMLLFLFMASGHVCGTHECPTVIGRLPLGLIGAMLLVIGVRGRFR